MHLRADTVNLGYAVCLPLFNPLDERLDLLVVIPVGLQVVVVNEQFNILWTILASQSVNFANVINVAQEVLPEEIRTTDIPCTPLISIGVLQRVVVLAVVTIASNSLIHHIPGFHLAVAGFHHALDPLLHRSD